MHTYIHTYIYTYVHTIHMCTYNAQHRSSIEVRVVARWQSLGDKEVKEK